MSGLALQICMQSACEGSRKHIQAEYIVWGWGHPGISYLETGRIHEIYERNLWEITKTSKRSINGYCQQSKNGMIQWCGRELQNGPVLRVVTYGMIQVAWAIRSWSWYDLSCSGVTWVSCPRSECKSRKLSQNQQCFLESKQWGMEKSSLPKKGVEEGLSSD